MATPYFFGFGSLVNRSTHDYGDTRPAHLPGWRRVWVQTSLREFAFLSAEPHEAGEIAGLMAAVPNANWAALDEREFAYRRRDVTGTISHPLPHRPDVALYSVPKDSQITATEDPAPILLSYLDVVVQGYFQVFGADGVAAFFESTHSWERPLLDDRPAPIYPRHRTLSAKETALVNTNVHRLDLKVIRPRA